MTKITPNNKPLNEIQRQKELEKERLKLKFADQSIDALLGYIEALEKRIEALEKRPPVTPPTTPNPPTTPSGK